MHYIPYKNRDRHKAVDQQIAAADAYVTGIPAVADALGQTFVRAFTDFRDNYFTPNYRFGKVSLTADQKHNSGQPVCAVEPDERLTLKGSGFKSLSPLQRETLQLKYADIYADSAEATHAVDVLEHALATRGEVLTTTLEESDAVAMVKCAGVELEHDLPYYHFVHGRPLMVLGMVEAVERDTVPHELVHCLQYTNNPEELVQGSLERDWIARETAAYSIGAAFLTALQASGEDLSFDEKLNIGTAAIINQILTDPRTMDDTECIGVFLYRRLDYAKILKAEAASAE